MTSAHDLSSWPNKCGVRMVQLHIIVVTPVHAGLTLVS